MQNRHDGRNRRKLRNLVQDPRIQYRYAIYFFGFSVVAAILNQMLMVRAFRGILVQTLLGTNIDPAALEAAVAVPLQALALRMTLMFPILGMVCAAFAIWITHKFVGPQVALRRHINALKAGNYDAVCKLRKGDELFPVAEALNELTQELRARREESVRAA